MIFDYSLVGVVSIGLLRVYVCQLRQKIEADPERPQFVLTEAGIGCARRISTLPHAEPISTLRSLATTYSFGTFVAGEDCFLSPGEEIWQESIRGRRRATFDAR